MTRTFHDDYTAGMDRQCAFDWLLDGKSLDAIREHQRERHNYFGTQEEMITAMCDGPHGRVSCAGRCRPCQIINKRLAPALATATTPMESATFEPTRFIGEHLCPPRPHPCEACDLPEHPTEVAIPATCCEHGAAYIWHLGGRWWLFVATLDKPGGTPDGGGAAPAPVVACPWCATLVKTIAPEADPAEAAKNLGIDILTTENRAE